MDKKITIEQYQALNNSFKHELVFHVGSDAGFYSEFNNMVLAVVYCLTNHIKFTLYSSDANFRENEGWNDFFVPFCDEVKDSFHHKYNIRYVDPFFRYSGIDKLKVLYWRIRHRHIFLTSDLFYKFRNVEFERAYFELSELGIEGGLRELCKYVIELIYKFNDKTLDEISLLTSQLNLPDRYVGFHIRGGDKYVEHKLEQCATYISKAELLTDVRKAFVLTDDYAIFKALQADFPHWEFYTLTRPDERGYFHRDFEKKTNLERKKDLIKLFASMEVLRKSEIFVGTFSSNPGMFLGMCMESDRVHGIDFDRWLLW